MFCNVERVNSYSNMRKILNFFKICYEIERLEHMDRTSGKKGLDICA